MQPYQINAEHALQAEGNWPGGRNKVPGHVLDRLAEQKLMGGYSKKKNPVCPECHTMRSSAGTCYC
jgi:tRNA(Ile2) C34 agmatinyltransferase TiaS